MISQAGLGRAGVTGDKQGSFQKLARLLLKVHYPTLFARECALEGKSATFTPMIRYALTSMSHLLSRRLLNLGFEIYSVSDAKFMEVAFRICTSFFHYYPVLSVQQYQHKGYAERKMNLVASIVQMSLNKHAELAREAKAAAKNMPGGAAGSSSSSKKKKRAPDAHSLGDHFDHHEGDEDHPSSSAEGQINPAIVDAMGSSSMELASAASASASAASSSRGRRRSFSQERQPLSLHAPAPAAPSASASRARSASASRGSVASHSVKKKAQVAARRPKTASSNPNAGSLNASMASAAGWEMQKDTGFDGNTSGSGGAGSSMAPPPAHATDLYASASTSSAYGTAFAPSSSRHRMTVGAPEEVSIESMAPHAVERSTHPNGEVLELHEGVPASQHGLSGLNQSLQQRSVKKAWVSEHDKGSRGVNVVGYVDQTTGFGERSPSAPKNDAAARSRNAEYSRAQDLTKLRRREAQAEEDRLRLLQLNHQEYATQNSPHVDPSANAARRAAWEQEGDLDELEEEEGKQAPAPQPFGGYAAEQQQQSQQQHRSPPRFATQSAQLSASQRIALTSPHVVGTEHELNSSFHRTEEPRVQRGPAGQAPPATHVHQPGHAHRQERQQQLQQSHSQSQLHSQQPQQQQGQNDLSSLSDALSQIADRNTATAKRVAQHSAKKMPRSQYQEQQQQQSPSSSPSQPAEVSSLLSAAPNTALETKLLSMLEQISSKMVAMENNMQAMEKKLAAASVAQQQQSQQPQQPPQQQQQQSQPPSQSNADSYSAHPAPSSQYRSQSRDSAPLSNPLVPEYAGHLWTPASSFYGPPRDLRHGNVNAIPEQAQRAMRAEAMQKEAEAREQQRRQQQQEEKSDRYIPPTLPPRPGFAPHSPGPRAQAPQHGSVPTPAPVAHAVPSQSTAFGCAAFAASSSSAASFHPSQSHSQPSPVITTGGSMPLSSFPPHSAFHPGHATAGSASLSRDQVIPSTDSFIESLKARLRQTEELIHTARTTAKDTEAFNPYQQPPYERPS